MNRLLGMFSLPMLDPSKGTPAKLWMSRGLAFVLLVGLGTFCAGPGQAQAAAAGFRCQPPENAASCAPPSPRPMEVMSRLHSVWG